MTPLDTPAVVLRLRQVEPRRGLAWVLGALALLRRHALAFSAMFASYLFGAIVVAAVIPWVGAVVVLASMPLLTLGFLIATRSVLDTGTFKPWPYLEPLRADALRRRRLLAMGVAYAVASIAAFALADAIDGGRFEQLQELLASKEPRAAVQPRIDALLADPRLTFGLAARLGFAGLVSIPFWHAPALVWWGGQGVAQSLFSSTVAVWRNRGAFVVYVAAWSAIVAAVGLVGGVLLGLLGTGVLVLFFGVTAGLALSAAFYLSLHYVWVDSFEIDPAAPPS